MNASSVDALSTPVSPAASVARSAEAEGFFGPYGGQFVPDTLKNVLDELAEADPLATGMTRLSMPN